MAAGGLTAFNALKAPVRHGIVALMRESPLFWRFMVRARPASFFTPKVAKAFFAASMFKEASDKYGCLFEMHPTQQISEKYAVSLAFFAISLYKKKSYQDAI